jgi:hypothetical protein
MIKYDNIRSSDRGVPYFFQECTFFKYQAISDPSGTIRLTAQYLRLSGKIRSFRFKGENSFTFLWKVKEDVVSHIKFVC